MIETRSSFFYLDPVDSTNFYLDFDEGGGELTAEVSVGSHTHSEIGAAVEAALNGAGALTYSVSFDRDTRKITISASGPFTLLIGTGTHVGADIFPLLGFTGSDVGPTTSATANLQAGTEYRPQFYLQDWVDATDNQRSISPSVSRTASGQVEVVKFGTEKFFEFSIMLVTDIDQGQSNFVESDPTAVNSLRSFMQFCVEKNNLEFMPDRDVKANFFKVLLESTEESRDGTGYKMKELYDKGLPNYFESGKLVFRLRES
jgi:hypothetical protein